jgi:hypothetical protein
MSLSAPFSTTFIVRATNPGEFKIEGPPVFQAGYPVSHPDGPDGIFANWHWNGKHLEAQVDRLGMFPLYYGELPDGIAISTHVDGVLHAGVSPDLNLPSLQVLLGLGFQVGVDTVFQRIKTFPIGGQLTWSPGRLTVTTNMPEVTLNPLSREKAIDVYLDLFRDAVRRRIVEGAPIRLPLSGGRDSRHILLELIALGFPPERCYTASFRNRHDDAHAAEALCRKLNVPHLECYVPEDLVTTELEKNTRLSYEALEHGWTWGLAQDMAHPEAISYDGLDGDVLSAGHFHLDENSRLYREGRLDELAEKLAPHPVLRAAPANMQVPRADAYQRIVCELLRYKSTHNPMMFFFLYNRSRRAVSTTISSLFGSVVRAAYAPYLDRTVFDFLAGLPEELFADKRFHTQAISRKFPEMDSVGYAGKSPLPNEVCQKYARQGARFALTASASRLFDRSRTLARFTKALVIPGYRKEAMGLFNETVFLNQVGRIANGA